MKKPHPQQPPAPGIRPGGGQARGGAGPLTRWARSARSRSSCSPSGSGRWRPARWWRCWPMTRPRRRPAGLVRLEVGCRRSVPGPAAVSRLLAPVLRAAAALSPGLRLAGPATGWNRPASRWSVSHQGRCAGLAPAAGPAVMARGHGGSVQFGVDDRFASASSSRIIWMSWATRNGSPTMSPEHPDGVPPPRT